ncbi:MAG TPA: RDD family protein [Blastocatellia bacterium]|nr:RDD family protein [Blastocatellia bacterium]
MSYGGDQPPGYPPGYPPPGYPPPGYQQPGYPQPGGYMPGGYGAAPTPPYAGIGKRFVAALLDGLVVGVAMIPGWIIYAIAIGVAVSRTDSRGQLSQAEGQAAGAMFLLAMVVIFGGWLIAWLFNIYLLGKNGATLGKRWMKIKVLDQTGQPLGFGKAFLRELVKQAVGGFCFILLLWPLWDQEKQGLYDKVFSTHVYEA